jgi:hypothetical protein
MARALRRRHDDAVRITTAASSRDADISARQRRYVFSMGVRTLCFVGAIVVGPGWLRWVLFAGAFLLPYFAVVMANSASPRIEGTLPPGPGHGRQELGPGPD